MKTFVLILCILGIARFVVAQNLVCNPGFEQYYTCPKTINGENPRDFLPCWEIPAKGTPDYFNGCSRFNVGVPDNNMGSQWAKEGKGYIGLVLFQNKTKSRDLNYREYVSAKLIRPVKKDSLYEVSFYYTPSGYSTYSVNQLHIGFCKKNPEPAGKILQPDYFVGIDTSDFKLPDGNWYYFCDTLQFNADFEYIVLGNFNNDSRTRWLTLDISEIRASLQEVIIDNQAAYYYIDQVNIHQIK